MRSALVVVLLVALVLSPLVASGERIKFWTDGASESVTRFASEKLGWKRVYWAHNARVLLPYASLTNGSRLDLRYVRDDQIIGQIEEIGAISHRSNLTLTLHESGRCPDELCRFTYVLDDPDECELLKERLRHDLENIPQNTHEALFNPADAERTAIPWILKHSVSTHPSRGPAIFWNARTLMDALRSCEDVAEPMVVQPYVRDGALIARRKACFQTHVLVASTHPLLVLYRDGVVWLAEEMFSASRSARRQVHFAASHTDAFSLHSMTFEEAARKLAYRLYGEEERWRHLVAAMRHAFKLSIRSVLLATKRSFRTPSALSNASCDWIPQHETGIRQVMNILLTGSGPSYDEDDAYVPRNRFHLLAFDFMLSGERLYPMLVDVQRVPSTAFRAQNRAVVEEFESSFRETFEIALEVMSAREDRAALYELQSRRSFHWLINEAREPAFYYGGSEEDEEEEEEEEEEEVDG